MNHTLNMKQRWAYYTYLSAQAEAAWSTGDTELCEMLEHHEARVPFMTTITDRPWSKWSPLAPRDIQELPDRGADVHQVPQ